MRALLTRRKAATKKDLQTCAHRARMLRSKTLLLFWVATCCGDGQAAPAVIALRTADTRPLVSLASREVQRYVYLRTGELLPIVENKAGQPFIDLAVDTQLGEQAFRLRSAAGNLHITGGSEVAVLYGAYAFAEKLGVRFYLHGDVVPDGKISLELPVLDELHEPLFELRGINPWGSHPYGFDAWNADDYKAVITQLAKLKMNFIGMHCYPEGHPYAEPTVWHGLPGDFDEQGRVTASYPSRYYNTLQSSHWSRGAPKRTGAFAWGGSLLFDDDAWAADVLRGITPLRESAEDCNKLFNRTGAQFGEAFRFARQLGVKTCLGTEAPITLPMALQQRIRSRGRDPKDRAVLRDVYEGTFRRIMAAHPLDYYWLWTPESWTWRGNKAAQYRATVEDILLAREALKSSGTPFQLATCGWVLGPQHDRDAFDGDLPAGIPMSAISRDFGYAEVDPAFDRIHRRATWTIPWLESDMNHGLAAVQLVAGRMLRDASDARTYGCTGLMGLHWRTKIIAPNIAALAGAAWTRGDGRDKPVHAEHLAKRGRSLPCDDFYKDWASVNFGKPAGEEIGRLFARIDGKVPISVDKTCPAGRLTPDPQPWLEVAPAYAFVDDLEQIRPRVSGKGNVGRFEYWLNTFKYHRSLARVRCALGAFQRVIKTVEAEKNPRAIAARAETLALPAYRDVLHAFKETHRLLLATVCTSGGFATVCEFHKTDRFWGEVVEKPATRLVKALGHPLPEDAMPSSQFDADPRLIVPTVRSQVQAGEALNVKTIILAEQRPQSAHLSWRTMGRGAWQIVPLRHVTRSTYTVELPPTQDETMEYSIEAEMPNGETLRWPATAPEINQTLVVVPGHSSDR